MKYRALGGVGILAVLVGSCVAACSSSSDSGGTGGTSSGGTGGTSAGGTSGGKGGSAGSTSKAGSSNAGTTNGEAGDTGDNGGDNGTGATGGEAGANNGAAGDQNNGGTGAVGGSGGTGGMATCVGANKQTDPKNCGSCGKVCESNECDEGECTPVVVLYPSTANPETVDTTVLTTQMTTALIGSNVYEWELTQDSPVAGDDLRYTTLRAASTPTKPPAAGAVIADLPRTSPAPQIGAVAYDATNIYQCGTNGVTRTALNASGATPTQILGAPVSGAGIGCSVITVTATNIFVVMHDANTALDTIYSVAAAAAVGAAVKPVAIPTIGARGTPLTNLTAVGTNLYWFDRVNGESSSQLVTAPITGGTPKVIDASVGSGGGLGLAADATYLYYTYNFGNIGEVRRAPLATLKPDSTPLTSDIDAFKGMVLNGGYLYFMESSSREVFRVKADGSENKGALGIAFVQTDDNAQHEGINMTGVDANFAYFLLNDGLIARLPATP